LHIALAGVRDGIELNDYMEHEDGELVFRHACKLGYEGYRVEAQGLPLYVRPIAGLDQAQEPKGAGGEAGGRGGLGAAEQARSARA
jgi:hypothetical protein